MPVENVKDDPVDEWSLLSNPRLVSSADEKYKNKPIDSIFDTAPYSRSEATQLIPIGNHPH